MLNHFNSCDAKHISIQPQLNMSSHFGERKGAWTVYVVSWMVWFILLVFAQTGQSVPSYSYKQMRKDIVIFDCPRCDAVMLEKLTQFAKNEQHI